MTYRLEGGCSIQLSYQGIYLYTKPLGCVYFYTNMEIFFCKWIFYSLHSDKPLFLLSQANTVAHSGLRIATSH